MRPLLVIAIACCILGGVKLFIDSDEPVARYDNIHAEVDSSSQQYDVEITLGFDAGPDEFSLEAAGEAPSLLLQLNGNVLLNRTDAVAAVDTPIVLEKVDGVTVGRNEFFVQSTPSGGEFKPQSLRIRILQNDIEVAEQTLWSEAGQPVQGTIEMEITQ